jgi:hypothetical protein
MSWDFGMEAFYANGVKPPKKPGESAVKTRHKTDVSLLMEVQAAKSRKDIGKIVWWGPVSAYTRSQLMKVLGQ